MSKGTPSFGKRGRGKHTHVRCPRCGKSSFNRRQEICASCGFGKSKRLNH
ncbi:MAG: 50S ribosomal protein L37e [Candidatus Altiarchaeota archaeon]|nr:50S ribosomal protein L37e [Candidatus Altiarchaeota archaeon]